jgi:hypothetical protein
MYHEEKEMGGFLYWRSTPNGDWVPFTLKQVTEKYILSKRQLSEVRGELSSIL